MFFGKCKILCSSLLIAASVTVAVPSYASMAANTNHAVNQKGSTHQTKNEVTVIPVQSEKQLEQKNAKSSGRISNKIQGIIKKDNTSTNYKDNGPVKPYDASSDTMTPTISYYNNNYGNDAIMGAPIATEEQCVKYLLQVNPNPQISVSPEELVKYYYEEATIEGVRPDAAFAQALKETGYFSYGGTVTPDQNNYCGLGTTSATIKGAYFATARLGVRAHIQHLLAYSSIRPPREGVVDPRYSLVRAVYSSSTIDTWPGLNGRWAVPGNNYGQEILQILNNIAKE